jgi:hypothetical protein
MFLSLDLHFVFYLQLLLVTRNILLLMKFVSLDQDTISVILNPSL